jgi:molecular chaperone GrpE
MTMNNTEETIQDLPREEVISKEQEYLNNWKRTAADLENYRKDEIRRIAEALQYGSEKMLIEVIDLLDNLEMAINHAPPDTNAKWLEGIKQVAKRFHEFLAKHGVEKIEALGEPFNPLTHEAVQIDQEGLEQGEKVLEEFRPGYKMGDKVIRPARVKISK